MENSYQYFKRDLSWLSFNYRVLLEAEDDTLPIYERIKFLESGRILLDPGCGTPGGNHEKELFGGERS